jgi:hypothetical protein
MQCHTFAYKRVHTSEGGPPSQQRLWPAVRGVAFLLYNLSELGTVIRNSA